MKRKLPKQSTLKISKLTFKNISKLIFFTNSILQKHFTKIFVKN